MVEHLHLPVDGANTIGVGTSGGNGLVFINGIFQTPTTANNPNNNFILLNKKHLLGISSIVFSGIRTDHADPNSILISESDINQNQIPRGGLIVSLGSTGGLGYAPLVGVCVLLSSMLVTVQLFLLDSDLLISMVLDIME